MKVYRPRFRNAGKAKTREPLSATVADALADSLMADLRCSEAEASLLSERARALLGRIADAAEDSDEDLVARLQDPRVFGEFAEVVLRERQTSDAVRLALVERTFDLLPLPRTEGEVFLVEARGPPRLLSLVAFLFEAGALTVLHTMHLVYAVYLDRGLVTNVDRSTRSTVLRAMIALPEANDRLRALYACLHLTALPESEAHAQVRSLFKDPGVPESVKALLARTVASDDGGRSILVHLAEEEGLIPPAAEGGDSAAVLSNVPRLPEGLAAVGRRWLKRRGGNDA